MNAHPDDGRITRNPDVLGDKPIVRGTRISVELIQDWVESGQTPEEIAEDYPGLTVEDINAAVAYGEGDAGEKTTLRT